MPEHMGEIMLYKGKVIPFSIDIVELLIESSFMILEPTANLLKVTDVKINDHVVDDDNFVVTFINNSAYSVELVHNVGTIPFFMSGGANYIIAPNSLVVAIYVLGKLLIKTT